MYAHSAYAGDLDGDGDMDVLSASRDDDKIAWYENDGTGQFGSQQAITNSEAMVAKSPFTRRTLTATATWTYSQRLAGRR